jgi:hypothetical protein
MQPTSRSAAHAASAHNTARRRIGKTYFTTSSPTQL